MEVQQPAEPLHQLQVEGLQVKTVQSSLHSRASVGSPSGKYSGGDGYNPQPEPGLAKAPHIVFHAR